MWLRSKAEKRRAVKTGDRDDRMRVVKEGLTADDWVIPEGLPAMPGMMSGGMTSGVMPGMGPGMPGAGPPPWQDGMAAKPRKPASVAPQPSSKDKKLPPSGTPSKK